MSLLILLERGGGITGEGVVLPLINLLWGRAIDFQKSPLSGLIWRGMKDFSYLIGASLSDPKMGRCA